MKSFFSIKNHQQVIKKRFISALKKLKRSIETDTINANRLYLCLMP